MARAAIEAAAFTRDRLKTVLPRLQKRLREVVAAEDHALGSPEYEAVQAKQVALAQELEELFCPAAERIVDLLPRIEAVDRPGRSTLEADTSCGDGRLLVETEQMERGSLRMAKFANVRDLMLPSWAPSSAPVWPPRRLIRKIVDCAEAWDA